MRLLLLSFFIVIFEQNHNNKWFKVVINLNSLFNLIPWVKQMNIYMLFRWRD